MWLILTILGVLCLTWIFLLFLIVKKCILRIKNYNYIQKDFVLSNGLKVHAVWEKKYARIWKDHIYGKWTLLWDKFYQHGIYIKNFLNWYTKTVNKENTILECNIKSWLMNGSAKVTYSDWKNTTLLYKDWKMIKSDTKYINGESCFVYALKKECNITNWDSTREKNIMIRSRGKHNVLIETTSLYYKDKEIKKYQIDYKLWRQFSLNENEIKSKWFEFVTDSRDKILFDLEWLDSNKNYVFIVSGLDENNTIVDISNEFTFKTLK